MDYCHCLKKRMKRADPPFSPHIQTHSKAPIKLELHLKLSDTLSIYLFPKAVCKSPVLKREQNWEPHTIGPTALKLRTFNLTEAQLSNL